MKSRLVGWAGVIPSAYVERATSGFTVAWALMALAAVADLAIRAALRLELRWVHYQVTRVDYAGAARLSGAPAWWAVLQKGQTYCVVDMVPIGFLLTGPTMSEYTIVDRTTEDLCPAGSTIVTYGGIRGIKGAVPP